MHARLAVLIMALALGAAGPEAGAKGPESAAGLRPVASNVAVERVTYKGRVPGEWTRFRIEVRGDKAPLYLKGQPQPSSSSTI